MPMPLAPPILFKASIISIPVNFSPFKATGIPFSKVIVIYVGVSGAFSGVTPSSRILSYNGSLAGFSRSNPSCDKCHKFLSLE